MRRLIQILLIVVMSLLFCTSLLFASGSAEKDQGKADEEVVLTYWTPETRPGPTKIRNERWVPEFEKEHPGVKVDVVNVPWGEFNKRIQQAWLTKSLPDVFYCESTYAGTYYNQGILQPVNDIVEWIGVDEFGEGVQVIHKVDDQWATVPWILVSHQLFFRKDWYEEAGLKLPYTWEDWYTASKKLTKDLDGDGLADQYGIIFNLKFPDGEKILWNLMASNDAWIFDKDKNVTINSDKMVEVLSYLKKLESVMSPGSINLREQDARMLFADGEGGSMITSASIVAILTDRAPELIPKLGSVTVPVNEGSHSWVWYGSLAMSSTSKNIDLAKDFIKWIYTGDNYTYYFQNTVMGHLPVLKSVQAENSAYWDAPRLQNIKHLLKPGLAAVDRGVLVGQGLGPNKYSGLIFGQGVLSAMAQQIIAENKSPEEVAEWGEEQILEIKSSLD